MASVQIQLVPAVLVVAAVAVTSGVVAVASVAMAAGVVAVAAVTVVVVMAAGRWLVRGRMGPTGQSATAHQPWANQILRQTDLDPEVDPETPAAGPAIRC